MAKRKLDGMSTADLHREIRKRERQLDSSLRRLHRRRAKLQDQISSIEAEIIAAGGSLGHGGRAGRKRPRNTENLADALARVLKSTTMSVIEVAGKVQEAGYQTRSPNFRTIVNQTLVKDSRFKRVGRGRYTVKG